jgi:hypothetical protein
MAFVKDNDAATTSREDERGTEARRPSSNDDYVV